jgi:hypothetical protein
MTGSRETMMMMMMMMMMTMRTKTDTKLQGKQQNSASVANRTRFLAARKVRSSMPHPWQIHRDFHSFF